MTELVHPFSVGDVVLLKSGGAPMTVTRLASHIDAELVTVRFFSEGRMWVEQIPPAALVRDPEDRHLPEPTP